MAQCDTSGPCVLYPEAEVYVQSLGENNESFSQIGTLQWLEKHAQLEKLNMQAAYEATNDVDESVKELLVLDRKIPAVVEEVIVAETWRERVFYPFLEEARKTGEELQSSTIPYMVLYHELTALTLLETVCFHEDCVLEMEDSVSDLIEYCCRSASFTISDYQCLPVI
jgi:hypothetical protein